MRLKEIKPGMVIHCKTEEEAKGFIQFLHEKGFKWNGEKDLLKNNHFLDYHEMTCYKVYEGKYLTVGPFGWFTNRNETVTEFSDLIIPELSAKEVLETIGEICSCHRHCRSGYEDSCPLSSSGIYHLCQNKMCAEESDKVIEICTKWREEHPKEEKKALETEWVYVVRIIKVHDNGKKECVHEVDGYASSDDVGSPFSESEELAERELKDYVANHEGNFFATLEHICRIKE